MAIRIGLVGLPSTGKTTILNDLKDILSSKEYKVKCVSEYARKFLEHHGGIHNMGNQYDVCTNQMMMELGSNLRKPDVVITESPVWVSLAYAQMYFLKKNEDFKQYTHLKDLCKDYKYDIILFCNSLGTYIDDGVRYQKEEELGKLEYYLRDTMHKFHKGDIITLPSSREARKETLECFIDNLEEYK